MRSIVEAFRILLIIIVIIVLFIWLMYHGSGHNIPASTDLFFGILVSILVASVLILSYLRKKTHGK